MAIRNRASPRALPIAPMAAPQLRMIDSEQGRVTDGQTLSTAKAGKFDNILERRQTLPIARVLQIVRYRIP